MEWERELSLFNVFIQVLRGHKVYKNSEGN